MSNFVRPLLFALAIAIVIGIGANAVFGKGEVVASPTGRVVATGDVQEVRLTFENYEYKLSPSTLVKDVPVRMTVDLDSVYGCMRDIVIKQFGVRKYVREGDNVIEFTPDKAGTINIACSMNMGRGTFEVVEADGTKSEFVEPQAQGSSCGSEGGCGCGGY